MYLKAGYQPTPVKLHPLLLFKAEFMIFVSKFPCSLLIFYAVARAIYEGSLVHTRPPYPWEILPSIFFNFACNLTKNWTFPTHRLNTTFIF